MVNGGAKTKTNEFFHNVDYDQDRIRYIWRIAQEIIRQAQEKGIDLAILEFDLD